MFQYKKPLSAEDSTATQWPDHAQEAIERLKQRSEEEKARDLAELRDFGERCQRLEQMCAELTEQYPDQWVALTESYKQVFADTIMELVEKIRDLGERPEFAAAKCMHKGPRWVIPG